MINNYNDFKNWLGQKNLNFGSGLDDAYNGNSIIKDLVNNNFIPSINSLERSRSILALQGSMGTNSILAQTETNRNTINMNSGRLGVIGGMNNEQLSALDNNASSQLVNLNLNRDQNTEQINQNEASLLGQISTSLAEFKGSQ